MDSKHNIRFLAKILFAALSYLAIAEVCYAQSVPLGSILWLRSDTGVVTQNGLVAIWHDQSGHGNDVRMDDTGSRPNLIIDSGRQAVLFHGWNYLQGPPIFPDSADYTIAIVAKVNNANVINNLISGNVHSLYFNSNLYPCVVHAWFQDQEVATVPVWSNGFSAITALYDQAYQQATLYVNGQFADSSYILSTSDTTLTIGSYNGSYFLQGEIEEILLYNRKLTPSEDSSLNAYLMTRYGIAPSIPLPKPDSTFSSIPNPFQLYPRGDDDSATVSIAGAIYRSGFDSIYVLQFKNNLLLHRTSQSLTYDRGRANFAFSPRIHAELSEYQFEVHLVAGAFDSLIALRDSIACGDMFLMDGQSNAFNGFAIDTFRNEYCRSLGPRGSENLRDTLWFEADNDVGGADQRIQQDLMAYTHIPTCSINEAIGGTPIEAHLRNDSDKYDLRTIYGRTLYRATKTGMLNAIKVIYWLQGESNYAPGYYQNFLTLYRSWKEDYPNLQKIYLLQMRPNYCDFGNIAMRDVQRTMGDSIPSVEPIASAAMQNQTGCHYNDDGYREMGDRFYLEFARDFYHATDTVNLRSPNAINAWYSKPDYSQIAILFSPPDAKLQMTDDTTVDGIFATLKDYLYLDDTSTHVQSVAFDDDTLFVNFDKASKAQSIQYLPDQWYNGSDSVVYEGPWIVNSRGFGALLWYDLPISGEPLSVNEPATSIPDVAIIPDPASRSISIDASALTGPIEATLISETGAIVWRNFLPADHPASLEFDLSDEGSGCYFLRLSNANTSIERKFILER
jgi:hypothetical protein